MKQKFKRWDCGIILAVRHVDEAGSWAVMVVLLFLRVHCTLCSSVSLRRFDNPSPACGGSHHSEPSKDTGGDITSQIKTNCHRVAANQGSKLVIYLHWPGPGRQQEIPAGFLMRELVSRPPAAWLMKQRTSPAHSKSLSAFHLTSFLLWKENKRCRHACRENGEYRQSFKIIYCWGLSFVGLFFFTTIPQQ